MNRDIIKAEIEWKENEGETGISPHVNIRVKIDDKDFSAEHGAYIEDIKLYNQDTFVNPTNVNDGISFFDDNLYGDKKIDKYQRVDNALNELFIENQTTPLTIVGNYKKVNGDYVQLEDSDLQVVELVSYSFNNSTYYYKNGDNYTLVDYSNRHKDYFYITTSKTKIYEYNDLQNDSRFAQNFNIDNDIVIISVKIHPHPNDECQSDYIIKVLYNKLLFKNDILSAIDEIGNRCVIPLRLIDFFLKMKAFELASETGDVEFMCRFMNIFNNARGLNGIIEHAPCGCLKH